MIKTFSKIGKLKKNTLGKRNFKTTASVGAVEEIANVDTTAIVANESEKYLALLRLYIFDKDD